ncbi:MAG: hypothetical protein JW708_06280, partial [Vallitaleaceae bacterium]|nr:hypothetical protein [Vallitaleaceae bacterium]
DDIHLAVEAVTTKEAFSAIHYWDSGINWKDIGVFGNLQWLRDVSKELMPVLYELVKRHIEDQVPVIIEGDFIDPELAERFDSSEVKTVFVCEKDKNHIIQNYLSREGGEVQEYRAEISVAYGNWLTKVCEQNDILVVEPKPWNTLMERVLKG